MNEMSEWERKGKQRKGVGSRARTTESERVKERGKKRKWNWKCTWMGLSTESLCWVSAYKRAQEGDLKCQRGILYTICIYKKKTNVLKRRNAINIEKKKKRNTLAHTFQIQLLWRIHWSQRAKLHNEMLSKFHVNSLGDEISRMASFIIFGCPFLIHISLIRAAIHTNNGQRWLSEL